MVKNSLKEKSNNISNKIPGVPPPPDMNKILEKYSSLIVKLKELLKNKPKVLFLGIGENRMGDDGCGPFIAFYLRELVKLPDVSFLNAGILPEERIDEIVSINPEIVILIDAIQNQRPPGSVDFYEEKKMLNYLPISSHSLPLPVFIDRCKRKIPGLKVQLLGITPLSLEFLEYYKLFEEDFYDLDAKDNDPNIPFYAFHLTPLIEQVNWEIIYLLKNVLNEIYQ